jgi:tetratricopeptide (TPR) repeat protein
MGLRISVVYSRLGWSGEAARLIEILKKKALSSRADQADLMRAEGEILLARGAVEDGLETLRRAHIASKSSLTHASLARALVKAGRPGEAVDSYRELVDGQPLPWEGHVEWALAHLTLGRLYEDAGDTANARALYLELLEVWKDADSDLPPLLETRRALERVSGGVS